MMLSEPGFWLIVAGALLVMVGFIGFAFSQMGNDREAHDADEEQQSPSPTDLPNPFTEGEDDSRPPHR
jgi:hypothetical protein